MKLVNNMAMSGLVLLLSLALRVEGVAQSYETIPFIDAQVGPLGQGGFIYYGNSVDIISGSGIGIAGNGAGTASDGFQFEYQQITGDVQQAVQVISQTGSGETGVMMRSSTDANASYIALVTQVGVGVELAYRAENGEQSVVQLEDDTIGVPVMLALVRSGNSVIPYEADPAGGSWTQLSMPIGWNDAPATLDVGLVQTSDANDQTSSATINDVTVLPVGSASATSMGKPELIGNVDYDDGVFTAWGAGTGFTGKSDQGEFFYSWNSGDITIVTRVASLQGTNSAAQAAISIRQSLDANCAQVSLILTQGNGISAMWRTAVSTTATVYPLVTTPVTTPYWLKLQRVGSVFSVSTSPDGVTWSTPVSTTITAIGNSFYFGYEVSNTDPTAFAKGVFDNLSYY